MRASILPLTVILFGLVASVPAMGEVLSISPAAFNGSYPPGFDATEMSPSGGYRRSLTSADTCEYAPVQLPDGAVVNSLTFWVRDAVAGSGKDITVRVWEKNTTTSASATPVLAGSSSGSSASIRAVLDFGSGTVDTATESWYLEACWGAAGLDLHHIAIDYTGAPAGIDTESPAVVPALALRTEDGKESVVDEVGGFLHGSSFNGGRLSECHVAPVTLPAGTRISMLSAALFDNDSSSNFAIQLRRKRLNNSQNSVLVAEISTIGASSLIRQFSSSSISNPVVSHAYEYFLTTPAPCSLTSGTHRIYAVRIHHDQPIFADGFESGDTAAWTSPSSSMRTLSLPAAAFKSSISTTINKAWVDPLAGRLNLEDGYCAVAPVTLPDGADLSLMVAFLVDFDNSRSLTVRLWAKRNIASGATELATATSSGSVGPTAALAILSGTISNVTHHYYLEACQPAGSANDAFAIQAVLIDYMAP